MPHLNRRPDLLTDYPFARLNTLLDGLTPGQDPLICSIGEPQHPVPALVAPALAAANALWSKYPPVNGTPDYRSTLARWLTTRYALPEGMIEADRHLLPVSGSREGLYMIHEIIVPELKNGKRPTAIMPNPFYQVYYAGALMAGAEPVLVDATEDTGFLPDFDSLPEETLARAAVVTLCSPANPQGAVATLEQWKHMIELARKHDFVLIADECYSEIYSDTPPPGALEACRDLGGSLKNVLVFNSLSKRSSVPGLRSGFVAGDPDLIARFAKLRSYACAGMPLPVVAAATALWGDEAHAIENRTLYQQKLDLAQALLGPRFGAVKPAGGFFLWLKTGDGEQATRRLWQDAGVKVLPGAYLAQASADGSNCATDYIRVALVHDLETTRKILTRIAAAV